MCGKKKKVLIAQDKTTKIGKSLTRVKEEHLKKEPNRPLSREGKPLGEIWF